MLSSSHVFFKQLIINEKKNYKKYVCIRRLVQLPWKSKQEITNHCHHCHWKICAHTEHKCLQKCLYVQNFISMPKVIQLVWKIVILEIYSSQISSLNLHCYSLDVYYKKQMGINILDLFSKHYSTKMATVQKKRSPT